jgi:hypothetical protein
MRSLNITRLSIYQSSDTPPRNGAKRKRLPLRSAWVIVDNVGHRGKFSKDNIRNKWTNGCNNANNIISSNNTGSSPGELIIIIRTAIQSGVHYGPSTTKQIPKEIWAETRCELHRWRDRVSLERGSGGHDNEGGQGSKNWWSYGIGGMGRAGSREWRSVEWFATLRRLMLRREV